MIDSELPQDEDRVLLRDSIRGLLEKAWPAARAVQRSAQVDSVREIWALLAGQGLASLGTNPSEGGLRELVIVLEELGRAGCPAPAIAAALLNVALTSRQEEKGVTSFTSHLHSGSAVLSFAFGAFDADEAAGSVRIVNGQVSGTLDFVEGAEAATHLAVLFGDEPALAVLALSGNGVEVQATRALGASGWARVVCAGAPVEFSVKMTARQIGELVSISRLLHAARAHGAARRAFELAVDYAKQRVQFGQPIGRFQAIQHKLANNLIALEGVRLALSTAAEHHDIGQADWAFFVNVAFAHANAVLRPVAMENIHALGAIGYSEEHEAPRHWKQVHRDLLRHGGIRRVRAELGEYFLGAARHALPQHHLGAVAESFRQEVRSWLDAHWTAERRAKHSADPHKHREYNAEFAAELGRTGWIGAGWPTEFGGQDRSTLEQLALMEEMERAGAPRAGAPIQAAAWQSFGTPDQQARYLPEILSGRVIYGMWYSEPGSGSDLASLRTRAVRDGDHWVVNGEKIWTTTYWGDYMWLAVRTDPDAKPKHAGISVFVVPTNSPGIEITPSKTMYDGEFVNTFFNDVRVPHADLVGELNQGWKVLTGSLGTERAVLSSMIAMKTARAFDDLCDYLCEADGIAPALRADPVVRDKLAEMAVQIEVSRQLGLHCARSDASPEVQMHEGALAKVYAGEVMERFGEAALDMLGMTSALSEGSPGAILGGSIEQKLRHSLMWVISVGTNEIQRNVIAQRGLGLPR